MTFSILIPCYNVSKYLPKCLDSVLQQTYKDWEIVLIDDGSGDETIEIIRQYAEKDKRIRPFFHNKNRGVAVTRNLLLQEALGEYIIFLDSDDWWKSERNLEKIYYSVRDNNLDIVVFQHEIVRCDGDSEYVSNNTHFLDKTEIYTGEEYLNAVLGKGDIYQWYPFLYAFKRMLWVENDIIFNAKRYAFEDEEVLYRVILEASKLKVMEEIVYQYRVGRKGQLTGTSKRLIESMLEVCRHNIQTTDLLNISDELKTLLNNNFAHLYYIAMILVFYLPQNDQKDIFQCLLDNKFVMNFTVNQKDSMVRRLIQIFGIKVVARLLYARSKWKKGF